MKPLVGKGKHKGTENLIPVKPGEVRNPTGANQYTYLRDAGLKVLDHGNLEKLLETLNKLGRRGNVLAIRELLDRVFGKAQQNIDLSNKDKTLQPPIINITDSKSAEILAKFLTGQKRPE